MIADLRSRLILAGYFALFAVSGVAQSASTHALGIDQEFQAAVANYNAGRLAEAGAELKALLPRTPKSFEVHELLGLIYAAQSQATEAVEQLRVAAQLRPDSAPAHTNLATALAHQGRRDEAEVQAEQALALAPNDYDANHDLAEFYIQANKIAEALPLLEAAQRARPDAYSNGYDLALAYLLTGKTQQARQQVDSLTSQKDTGELHALLGRIDEQEGKFIDAANEFEAAAHKDPSEDNLFIWGSDLLLHRAYVPAIEVFRAASERYSQSPRLLIGLGMALFSRGEYEDSIQALLKAADLNPKDPRCYLFLSKAYLLSPNQARDVIERFRRYAELEPGNAMAQYYYAVSLWKGIRTGDTSVDSHTVESLLEKAIALDGSLAEAHLQLGILYSDQRQYDRALPEYQRALQLDQNLADAHYRLGQYYAHAGDKVKSQQELDLFRKLQEERLAAADRQRAEVQQFVVAAGSSSKP